MKRLLALLWILSLGLGNLTPAALAVQAENPAPAPVEERDADSDNALVVGSLTPMSGFFFTDMWGNNSSDMDVRTMLHGYATVAWAHDGNFVIDNTAIQDAQWADNEAGNRTYTFTLNEGLVYNDGAPILARDYAFAALLRSCPQAAEIGGMNRAFSHLTGYEAFQEGAPFSGVRLLGDRQFSLTIKGENLPNFYEMNMINVEPAPIEIIAPGFDIVDVGTGCAIVPLPGGEDLPFRAEALRRTLLDPETGYLSHPMRTSGPYQLVSFDRSKGEASFLKNDRYLGNYEGRKPLIERVTFLQAEPGTMFEDLSGGRVGLINKVAEGEAIALGLDMREEGGFASTSYPRAGLAMLAFACETGPTRSSNLRKAAALCMDEQALCEEYLQGHGIPVYGYYGLGQWVTQAWMREDPDALLELCLYSLDLNDAGKLLEEDGWIYNSQGAPYVPGEGGVRYRLADPEPADGELAGSPDGEGEENGLTPPDPDPAGLTEAESAAGGPQDLPAARLEPLTLRCAFTRGGTLVPYMYENWVNNLRQIGAEVQCDELPFQDLLRQYYRQNERDYHILLLATNFQYVFDPYYTFNGEDPYQGVLNTTGIRDQELERLADELRRVAPGDADTYRHKWMDFQKRWVDVLPMAPLYSNVYFDFYRQDLRGYSSSSNNTWAAALLYCSLGPAGAEEADAPFTFEVEEDE